MRFLRYTIVALILLAAPFLAAQNSFEGSLDVKHHSVRAAMRL